jgi:hypothetical protein
MNGWEIDLAAEMLVYSTFPSTQEVKNLTLTELNRKLRFFFSEEILTEAARKIISGKEEEK